MKIGVVISSQHSIPHGGIGQFVATISKLLESYGHEVDFLLDKKPKNNFIFNYGNRHYFNTKPLQSITLDRHSQDIDYNKIQNFVSILEHFHKDYDLLLINSSEAIPAVCQIKTKCQVIIYTHLFNQIHNELAGRSVFTQNFVDYYNSFLYRNDIIVATQTTQNKDKLISHGVKNCLVLPMPMTETDLLSSHTEVQSGILYIGTYSPGKNPTDYIKVMSKLKLPCKVMTSIKGKKKFIEQFEKHNITDYDIRVGITGSEKVNFIKSCKLFYNTSLYESYSYATFECIGHMPVVVSNKQNWINNFDSQYYKVTNIRKATEVIQQLYTSKVDDDRLLYVNNIHQMALEAWKQI